MSGITGIFRLDGTPVSSEVLQRMTDKMAHRGPDGSGSWNDGPVGLGHRMLCTTPESLRERQPVVDEDARLALIWDGRVDNREELCADLHAKPADATDAELVLRAYRAWGIDFLPRVLGDFALAVWDGNERRLVCARDVLGQRPLYYWCDDKTFLFASEFQPLFEYSGVQREPNLGQAARFLVHDIHAEDETFYEGVLRVQSAQCLVVGRNAVRKFQYWQPDPEKRTRYRTDRDYAEHFGLLFREAVRCRMRTTGDVGVLVSGGLDSTSIACMAQKLRNEQAVEHGVRTFSTVYNTLSCDERDYINSAVEMWSLDATLNVYEEHPQWLDFELNARFPDAFYNPTDHIQEFSQMRDRGIRVYFDGIGGDELLAPDLGCITDSLRKLKFLRAWKDLRAASTTYGSSLSRFGLMYCVAPFVPECAKRLVRPFLRRERVSVQDVVVIPRLSERLASACYHVRFSERGPRSILDDFYAGSSPIAVELEERLACSFPLECRRPFADRRLLEYTLSIPYEQVWRPGQPIKTILREAMQGVLPEKVRGRTGEAEFSPLVAREFRERQRKCVDELIRDSYLAKLGVVNPNRLQECWKGYCNGSNTSSVLMVIYLIGWELWYRNSLLKHRPEHTHGEAIT